MKLYVAGKISNEEGYRVKFANACTEVLTLDHVPVNPCELHAECDCAESLSWQAYMKHDLKALLDCDGVYALKDWQDSKGAAIEVSLAISLGMPVLYQKNYQQMLVDAEQARSKGIPFKRSTVVVSNLGGTES